MAGRKVFAPATVLTAADVNSFLMDQSVMVFDDSTARDTAIPSPIEGMVTYVKDSDHLDVYDGSAWVIVNDNTASIPLDTVEAAGDLIVASGSAAVTNIPVGTNGQTLSTDGTAVFWDDPAGGGGSADWQQISAGTITSGSTTFSLTSLPAYDKYLLLVNGAKQEVGASNDLIVRPNGSTATNYKYSGIRMSSFGVNNTTEVNFAANGFLLARFGDNAASRASGAFRISGAQSSGGKAVSIVGAPTPNGNNFRQYILQGVFDESSVISSIDLVCGTMDTGGTYELWGSN
jgi:hypothetical protein